MSRGTEAELKQAALDGTIEIMNKFSVEKGDVIFIPSGLIHTICEGLTLIELCCNSYTTYRIYDYNRGRGLDLAEGFEVVDLGKQALVTKGLEKRKEGYRKSYLCLNESFSWEQYEVEQSFTEWSDPARFYLFTCIEGEGKIVYKDGFETILIPAGLGQYKFEGQMKVLKSYVPDVKKVENEILNEIEYTG